RRNHAEQKYALYALVDPVSPPFQLSAIRHQQSASQDPDPITDPCFLTAEWWRRRVLPPGPKGLFRRPFIAIAGSRRHPEYRQQSLPNKDPRGASDPGT